MSNEEENLMVRFYDKVIKTDDVRENNMPVFIERTYIEIRIPDDRDVVNRPADKEDMERFPTEYRRYLNNKKKAINGTPLNQYSFLTAIQAENCKYLGIETVEELAELSDDKVQAFDLLNERTAARTFLENAKGFTAKEEQYKTAIEELRTQNEELKAEVEKLNAEIAALKTAKTKEEKKTSNK